MKTIIKTLLGITIFLAIASTIYYFSGSYSFFTKEQTIIEQDINEKINYEELLENNLLINKDYSNSIYEPYYLLLNDNQKQIYNELIIKINNIEPYLEPSITITVDEISDSFYAVIYDHPELFWLEAKYTCEYIADSNEVTKINLNYFDIINDIENAKNKFNEEFNKIYDEAKELKYDYEKEKYVHDTLINKIDYSTTAKYNQSAYGALVENSAACAGYAKSFQLIMKKLGIPTYYITGISNESHAWNLIELEDGFYNIDLTFDDQTNRIIYRYFNIPDDIINKDHTRTELSTKIIKAEGFKYINKYTTLIE